MDTPQKEEKSELEYLKSIDHSVGIIKRIAIWFLVVSFLGMVVGLIVALYSGGVVR
jgi:hypothetical protein